MPISTDAPPGTGLGGSNNSSTGNMDNSKLRRVVNDLIMVMHRIKEVKGRLRTLRDGGADTDYDDQVGVLPSEKDNKAHRATAEATWRYRRGSVRGERLSQQMPAEEDKTHDNIFVVERARRGDLIAQNSADSPCSGGANGQHLDGRSAKSDQLLQLSPPAGSRVAEKHLGKRREVQNPASTAPWLSSDRSTVHVPAMMEGLGFIPCVAPPTRRARGTEKEESSRDYSNASTCGSTTSQRSSRRSRQSKMSCASLPKGLQNHPLGVELKELENRRTTLTQQLGALTAGLDGELAVAAGEVIEGASFRTREAERSGHYRKENRRFPQGLVPVPPVVPSLPHLFTKAPKERRLLKAVASDFQHVASAHRCGGKNRPPWEGGRKRRVHIKQQFPNGLNAPKAGQPSHPTGGGDIQEEGGARDNDAFEYKPEEAKGTGKWLETGVDEVFTRSKKGVAVPGVPVEKQPVLSGTGMPMTNHRGHVKYEPNSFRVGLHVPLDDPNRKTIMSSENAALRLGMMHIDSRKPNKVAAPITARVTIPRRGQAEVNAVGFGAGGMSIGARAMPDKHTGLLPGEHPGAALTARRVADKLPDGGGVRVAEFASLALPKEPVMPGDRGYRFATGYDGRPLYAVREKPAVREDTIPFIRSKMDTNSILPSLCMK